MENLKEQIQKLQKIIDTYDNIVFFGGAGVSTESGIPDFRSVDGLYHQQYDYPPETILSHSFYRSHPEEFFRFYRNKMLFPNAQPNAAHKKLAELEPQANLHDLRIVPGPTHTNVVFDVVLPAGWKGDRAALVKRLRESAAQKNEKYICVIKLEQAYA